MIDGLKLTFTGDELRRLLQERVEHHRAEAARLEARLRPDQEPDDDDDDDDDAVLLPEHMLEAMIDRHEWRGNVLDFIHAHIDAGDTYRLGQDDLEFAELLPETPAVVEDERFDAGPRLAFEVGRLCRAISTINHGVFRMSLVDAESTADVPDAP